MGKNKRWTTAEDSRLLRQVKAFPQNLSRCFMIVAEETGRTPQAVAFRWYATLSKRPENIAFITISEHHKTINRKNGIGKRSSKTLFQRIIRILGLK